MILSAPDIVYPETDGKPMAENTLQYKWVTTIKGGIHAQYRNRSDVFVAGDLFWYPIEGDTNTCTAPDTMVVFGRPPGHRPSYKQFEEGGIPPQVVFEILSHSNRPKEMREKLAFYDRFGVEEYYVYNPYRVTLEVYLRRDGELKRKAGIGKRFVSPLLSVKFELGSDLVVTGANGRQFEDYPELVAQLETQELRANYQEQNAIAYRFRADGLAEQVKIEAERADEEARRAKEAVQREADVLRQNGELQRQLEELRARLKTQ